MSVHTVRPNKFPQISGPTVVNPALKKNRLAHYSGKTEETRSTGTVHTSAKARLMAGEVTASLAESNGSLPPGG